MPPLDQHRRARGPLVSVGTMSANPAGTSRLGTAIACARARASHRRQGHPRCPLLVPLLTRSAVTAAKGPAAVLPRVSRCLAGCPPSAPAGRRVRGAAPACPAEGSHPKSVPRGVAAGCCCRGLPPVPGLLSVPKAAAVKPLVQVSAAPAATVAAAERWTRESVRAQALVEALAPSVGPVPSLRCRRRGRWLNRWGCRPPLPRQVLPSAPARD